MQALSEPLLVSSLLLDSENPRLPENLLGGSQDEILTYLFENDVLEELAASIQLNGFFQNEPLIVLPANSTGQRVVVEGNRRLATLQILLQTDAAVSAGLRFDERYGDLESDVSAVRFVPAFEVSDRRALAAYLGFRHINGIRTWGSSEKARFVWQQVNLARELGDSDPFFTVGRTVGSNARGVRTSYLAYGLLREPEVAEVDPKSVDFVLRKRFGVWTRLLGTKNVPMVIRLDRDARSVDEVVSAIREADHHRIIEIVHDLTPKNEATPAVLYDSRDVTSYSDVIGEQAPYQLLRETKNLALAKSVFEQSNFDKQLAETVSRVNILLEMVSTQESMTIESATLAQRLSALSRSLLGAVRELSRGDEED